MPECQRTDGRWGRVASRLIAAACGVTVLFAMGCGQAGDTGAGTVNLSASQEAAAKKGGVGLAGLKTDAISGQAKTKKAR
jgi:hypothetical protein